MLAYIIRRLLLVIPTLFAIIFLNFIVIQLAPGGPVEQALAQIEGMAVDATARIRGTGQGEISSQGGEAGLGSGTSVSVNQSYRGARGLDPELVREIEKLYGFDKPAYERFFIMVQNLSLIHI